MQLIYQLRSWAQLARLFDANFLLSLSSRQFVWTSMIQIWILLRQQSRVTITHQDDQFRGYSVQSLAPTSHCRHAASHSTGSVTRCSFFPMQFAVNQTCTSRSFLGSKERLALLTLLNASWMKLPKFCISLQHCKSTLNEFILKQRMNSGLFYKWVMTQMLSHIFFVNLLNLVVKLGVLRLQFY